MTIISICFRGQGELQNFAINLDSNFATISVVVGVGHAIDQSL